MCSAKARQRAQCCCEQHVLFSVSLEPTMRNMTNADALVRLTRIQDCCNRESSEKLELKRWNYYAPMRKKFYRKQLRLL